MTGLAALDVCSELSACAGVSVEETGKQLLPNTHATGELVSAKNFESLTSVSRSSAHSNVFRTGCQRSARTKMLRVVPKQTRHARHRVRVYKTRARGKLRLCCSSEGPNSVAPREDAHSPVQNFSYLDRRRPR